MKSGTYIKLKTILAAIALNLVILGAPFAAQAALPGIKCGVNGNAHITKNCLIPCSGVETQGADDYGPCTFTSLMELMNNVIVYLILISVPLAAVSFAWAGWLFISAGGNSGQISKAWGIFGKVGTGLALIIAAWLIVKTVTDALLNTNAVPSPLK